MAQKQTEYDVPLYRIENPTIPAPEERKGITSDEGIVGGWFLPDLGNAIKYLRKSTQTFGRDAKIVGGARLVVAHVPSDRLASFHVSNHPIASGMDVENDNYIIPRDGSVPVQVISLDGVIGDLRGQFQNQDILREAGVRIGTLLGELALK